MSQNIDEGPCEECGKVHSELPCSFRVLEHYKSYVDASPGDKPALFAKLAELLNEEYDPTDALLTDDYHAYFEEYTKAQLAFATASARLSRFGIQVIETYLADSHQDLAELVQALKKSLDQLN